MVRKVSLTKAVFMALLKDPRWHSVIQPLEEQPFSDGTVFNVHDVRRLCAILLRTYELGSKKATHEQRAKQKQDCAEVLCFLDRALAQVAAPFPTTSKSPVPSRSCPPWLSLRSSIKEANIQPMALVAKNAGISTADESQNEEAKRRVDWYMRKVGAHACK